jgi:hypothetical protein
MWLWLRVSFVLSSGDVQGSEYHPVTGKNMEKRLFGVVFFVQMASKLP